MTKRQRVVPGLLFALAMIAYAGVIGSATCARVAQADDVKAIVDGGSLCTSTDGGGWATCALSLRANCSTMAIRCEGAQSSRYTLCPTSTCNATAADALLDSDRTFDVPVNCGSGQNVTPNKYLGLITDDAGVPFCKVYKQP